LNSSTSEKADHKAERNARREDTEQINTCQTGPFPAFIEDAHEEDKAEPTPEQFPDPDQPLEDGNRIWATRLFPQAEHIRATATVSQWLAEGFRQNSQPSEHIPPHLRDFHSVFLKDSFDELSGTKPWDHTVELAPDASPKSCKVYPLSASEQKELDAFLKENHDSGQIRPSKSPFFYNNHVHSSMQQTPFLLDTSRHPWMGFEQHQPPSRVEAVNEFTNRMKDTLEEAKLALAKAKDDMARYYKGRRSPAPTFSPGDMVYLDSEDIQTTRPSKKLSHRRLGPYPVERRIGRYAYRLFLPPPMRRLHLVFNVVKLSPAPDNPIVGRCRNPPPPPELVDGEEEYIVEEILNSRMF